MNAAPTTDAKTGFAGLRVAAFESRRAQEMRKLIARHHGRAEVSPSMRETRVHDDAPLVAFIDRLAAGEYDLLILLTGVGLNRLVDVAEANNLREKLVAALEHTTLLARGPKPDAALRALKVEPTLRAAEPNTWREVLAALDAHRHLAGCRIAVQEYGVPNRQLNTGLAARGAQVDSIKVYNWELPDDVEPLRENVRRIAAGEIDVLLFTSSFQVLSLLEVARQLDLEDALRQGLRNAVIASIGPTTSETLRENHLPVDLEPAHPRMGQLVAEAAARSTRLLQQKQRIAQVLSDEQPDRTTPDDSVPAWHDSPFMRACRREPTPRVPIWLMRQAGRYMAEYRAVREQTTFLELCKNPALCAEIMITAVDRLGVDAAIIFSDLLPILEPMGFELEFAAGEGPVIHNPLRDAEHLSRVVELESVDALNFVVETVVQTRAGLPDHIPVIGFAGAPFTLASYAIEGGSSRNFLHTKTLMYRDQGAWDELLHRLTRSIARYLTAQYHAGAQAVQIFDSWVGCLGPADYRRFVLPHMRDLFALLPPDVPVIHFGTGNPQLLPLMASAGGTVIGVDWRIDLDRAWDAVGHDRAVQGNLDPLVLLADQHEIRRRAKQVLDQAAGRPGHIFNLGHGVLPQTPVENAIALIDAVHEFGPSVPAVN